MTHWNFSHSEDYWGPFTYPVLRAQGSKSQHLLSGQHRRCPWTALDNNLVSSVSWNMDLLIHKLIDGILLERWRLEDHHVLQNKFKANLDYMSPCIKPNKKKKTSTFFCSELFGGRFSLILVQVMDVSTVSSKSTLVTGIRYCYEKFKDSLPRHLEIFWR